MPFTGGEEYTNVTMTNVMPSDGREELPHEMFPKKGIPGRLAGLEF